MRLALDGQGEHTVLSSSFPLKYSCYRAAAAVMR